MQEKSPNFAHKSSPVPNLISPICVLVVLMVALQQPSKILYKLKNKSTVCQTVATGPNSAERLPCSYPVAILMFITLLSSLFYMMALLPWRSALAQAKKALPLKWWNTRPDMHNTWEGDTNVSWYVYVCVYRVITVWNRCGTCMCVTQCRASATCIQNSHPYLQADHHSLWTVVLMSRCWAEEQKALSSSSLLACLYRQPCTQANLIF